MKKIFDERKQSPSITLGGDIENGFSNSHANCVINAWMANSRNIAVTGYGASVFADRPAEGGEGGVYGEGTLVVSTSKYSFLAAGDKSVSCGLGQSTDLYLGYESHEFKPVFSNCRAYIAKMGSHIYAVSEIKDSVLMSTSDAG